MHHPSFEPVRPSVRPFISLFVCSSVHSFVRSFVCCVLGCLFFSPRCPFTLKGRTLYTRFVRLYLQFAKSVCLWYVNNASGVCSVFFLPFQNGLPFLYMYFFRTTPPQCIWCINFFRMTSQYFKDTIFATSHIQSTISMKIVF